MSSNLILDISANIASLQRDMAAASTTIQGFAKSTERAFSSLKGIMGAAGVGLAMGESIQAFMAAEKASMKLAVAMKNQGDYSKEALSSLQDYAAELQKTTSYEDDSVTAIMANLKTYGMLNEEVQKSTKAILDLTTAKQDEGMTIERASELIGKAYMGETTMLKRVGIIIDENTPKAQRFNEVMEQVQQRFGGAASAELETYEGQWKRIKNVMGDVAEVVGLGLLKGIEAAGVAFNTFAVLFYTGLENIAGAIGWLTGSEWAREAEQNYSDIREEAQKNLDKNMEMLTSFDSVGGAIDKMGTTGKRTMADLNKEADKLRNTLALDEFKERTKALTEFEADYAKIGKSTTAIEITELEIKLSAYSRFVDDTVRLEEMRQALLKDIMLRARNEQLALYEELLKAGQYQYADKMIDIYREIEEANREKNAVILNDDAAALSIMETRMNAHVQRITGMVKEEAGIIASYIQTGYGYNSAYASSMAGGDSSQSMSSEEMAREPYMRGVGIAPSKGYTVYYNNVQARQYETTINKLDTIINVGEDLQAIAERQLEQQKKQTEKLMENTQDVADWLSELSFGDLSPVSSAAQWATRFEELRAQARQDEARIGDFLSFAQQYLQFEKNYGTSGSYSSAYQNIVGGVQEFGGFLELATQLSNLGIGGSLGEINAVINAFDALGVGITELKAAADTAAGTGLSALSSILGTTLPDAAMDSAGGTAAMANTVQGQLANVGSFFDTLATKMGITFTPGSAEAAIKNLTPAAIWSPFTKKYAGGYTWYDDMGRTQSGPTPPLYGYSNLQYLAPREEIWLLNSATSETKQAKWGALTDGPTLAGEAGQEWVVPTYEPQRSKFLHDVGVDPDAIGAAIAKQINGGGPVQVSVQIDGREIALAVAKQMSRNSDLRSSVRSAMN